MCFQFIWYNLQKVLQKLKQHQYLSIVFLIIISGIFASLKFYNSSEKSFSGTWEDAGNIGIVILMSETKDEKIKGFVHFKSDYNNGMILPIEYSCVKNKYAVLGVPYRESIKVDPFNSIKFEITLFNENKIIGCMIDNRRRDVFDFVLSRIPRKKAIAFWKMAIKK